MTQGDVSSVALEFKVDNNIVTEDISENIDNDEGNMVVDNENLHITNSPKYSSRKDSIATPAQKEDPFPKGNAEKTTKIAQKSFTISGIIQILISFYQIRSLVNIQLNDEGSFVVTDLLDNIINVKMFLEIGNKFCPYHGVEAVGKAFINNIMLSITLTVVLSFAYLVTLVYNKITKSKPKNSDSMSF